MFYFGISGRQRIFSCMNFSSIKAITGLQNARWALDGSKGLAMSVSLCYPIVIVCICDLFVCTQMDNPIYIAKYYCFI